MPILSDPARRGASGYQEPIRDPAGSFYSSRIVGAPRGLVVRGGIHLLAADRAWAHPRAAGAPKPPPAYRSDGAAQSLAQAMAPPRQGRTPRAPPVSASRPTARQDAQPSAALVRPAKPSSFDNSLGGFTSQDGDYANPSGWRPGDAGAPGPTCWPTRLSAPS